jgi:hypothetical protein
MKKILGLFLIAGCLLAKGQENYPAGILSDTSKVMILQLDSLHTISLSKEVVAIAEKVFRTALDSQFALSAATPNQNKRQQRKSKGFDIKRYNIQLVPRLNVKGELEVWVNCFCPLFFPFNWRKEIFSRHTVEDGGSCFFDLLINIERQEYSHFGMNGTG